MQQSQERDLARRWASGEFIGLPLRTTSGARLTVLYPGRPGAGAGPLFRDAVIRLGDVRTVYGDVEIHLRGSIKWPNTLMEQREMFSLVLAPFAMSSKK